MTATVPEAVCRWAAVGLAAVGALAVAVGWYETLPLSWPAAALCLTLLAAAGWCGVRHARGRLPEGMAAQLGGPLLWTVAAWQLFRLAPVDSGYAVILPAAVLAWLLAAYPLRVAGWPLLAAVAMEAGLLENGHQPFAEFLLDLAVYLFAASGFALFARSQVHRRRLRKALARARQDAATAEYARDLGLFEGHTSFRDTLVHLDALDKPGLRSRPTVEIISASFELQLELLRQSLGLTTAAVLWPDPDGRELRLRSIVSARQDIDAGPYAAGTGIAGAVLRNGTEVAVAPVGGDYRGLPYYRQQGGVGGLFAIPIPTGTADGGGVRPAGGVLCVDRQETAPWNEGEREMLRLAARKLAVEVTMGRRLEEIGRERSAIEEICLGLRDLNAVLELDAAFEATVRLVKRLLPADGIAISLLEQNQHQVVRAEGRPLADQSGRRFPREEGLVGQVLKLNRSLPAEAVYRGPAPVFANSERLNDCRSLLILPLRKEGEAPIGALVVAAKRENVFTRPRRELLELIATQVAVKIDLARAHEQINRMATVDGLTELANHRTFQHAFDVMLERAGRRRGPLCLLLCDIDHFKRVNDTYGHPFGDQVLKGVAGVLAGTVRKVDLAARYGGEEFAVLLEDSDSRGGRRMAERIRQGIKALAIHYQGEPVTVTISIGMACYSIDARSKSELIALADQALYEAKRTGRDRLVVWQEAQQALAGTG